MSVNGRKFKFQVQDSNLEYRKVAKSSLSQLVARFQNFRWLIKEKFEAYVHLAKKF